MVVVAHPDGETGIMAHGERHHKSYERTTDAQGNKEGTEERHAHVSFPNVPVAMALDLVADQHKIDNRDESMQELKAINDDMMTDIKRDICSCIRFGNGGSYVHF